ncbi:MAG: AAA family ATPase [Planctomycetes bacterium]|nr:AAA family ATPase [Planctomycetota bacterium]
MHEGDIDELTRICKSVHGLADPNAPSPVPEPLTAADIPTGGGGTASVNLIGVKELHNVNALAEGQHLGFGPLGLTIVYGDNASGKSGYARVLKRACRARARASRVLANVFEAPPASPPRAVIDYQVGGNARSATWQEGAAAPPELAEVSFFDSDCAAIHIGEANELAFTPFGLDLLMKLAEACRSVQRALRAEREQLQRQQPASLQRPQADAGTAVRARLGTMTKDSQLTQFQNLATLSDAEQTRLRDLRRAFSEDPAVVARELNIRFGRIRALRSLVDRVADGLSDESIQEIRRLLEHSAAAKHAAELAAKGAFTAQPLPNVGGETWRLMWEAARRYSELDAYPNRAFPVTGDEARCVLCQQPLDKGASDRLRRFEDFIRGDLQRVADESRQRIERRLVDLRSLGLRSRDYRDALRDIGLPDGTLERAARKYLVLSRLRRRALLKNCEVGAWGDIARMPDAPLGALAAASQSLDGRIAELRRVAASGERARLRAALNDLEARVWLSQVMDDVRAEIDRLVHIHRLDSAIADTNTTNITLESTELTDRYVGETVCARFKEEAKQLGGAYLKIDLASPGGRYGAKRFQVTLRGAQQSATVPQVLSEGERCSIAIAGFLAELVTSPSRSALVFDDPVCSLDHGLRRKVADRLAEEARQRPDAGAPPPRQVIVFTHDTVFLLNLMESCRSKGVTVTQSHVQRDRRGPGVCVAGVPWGGKTVGERIRYLRSELQSARAIFNAEGYPRYEPLGRSLYGLLRETWERAVEEILLNGAVVRFGRGVQTKRLHALTDITREDVRTIDEAMSKCSRYLEGHDEAAAINEPVPEPDEVAEDIRGLDEWATAVRGRRKN